MLWRPSAPDSFHRALKARHHAVSGPLPSYDGEYGADDDGEEDNEKLGERHGGVR